MPNKPKTGREVLQHPTTQEAATLLSKQRANYDHLDQQFTTFSDEYVTALVEANAHPELLEEC